MYILWEVVTLLEIIIYFGVFLTWEIIIMDDVGKMSVMGSYFIDIKSCMLWVFV